MKFMTHLVHWWQTFLMFSYPISSSSLMVMMTTTENEAKVCWNYNYFLIMRREVG